jgi:hypothetical protein
MTDISAYIAGNFHVDAIKQTIHNFLKRDLRVKSCRGIPMEDKRVEVTQEQILQFFTEAIERIEGVPSHFVFNMDEMGHAEWADRTEKVCMGPSTHEGDRVSLPVSRAGKRITLMVLRSRLKLSFRGKRSMTISF